MLQEIEDNQSQQLLIDFEPLILAVVDVARGNRAARPQVESLLSDLNNQGWPLLEPIQHIWDGERSLPILSAELDQQDGMVDSWQRPLIHQIVQRILEELDSPN